MFDGFEREREREREREEAVRPRTDRMATLLS
jgi:hypothetical protein